MTPRDLKEIAEALEDVVVTTRNPNTIGYLRRIAEALEDVVVTTRNPNTIGYLRRIAEALAATVGGDVDRNQNAVGYWSRIAELFEQWAGVSTVSTANIQGYSKRILAAAQAGAAPVSVLKSIVADSGGGILYDIALGSSLFQDTAKTTAATDGDLVRTIDDAASGSLDAVADSDGERPALDTSGAVHFLSFDGVDDRLKSGDYTPPSDATVVIAMRTSDTKFILADGEGFRYVGSVQDGSGSTSIDINAGDPAYYVDGVLVAINTRDGLHTAIADGNWHVVEIVGADLSAWGSVAFGASTVSGWETSGDVAVFAVLDSPTSANRLALRSAINTIIGI